MSVHIMNSYRAVLPRDGGRVAAPNSGEVAELDGSIRMFVRMDLRDAANAALGPGGFTGPRQGLSARPPGAGLF